jgi:hypothetical protein
MLFQYLQASPNVYKLKSTEKKEKNRLMTKKKLPNTEGKVKEGTYQLSALFQAGPYGLQAKIYRKEEVKSVK